MTELQPPRDWFPTIAGLGCAAVLAGALGWAFWTPATRMVRVGFDEVWVTIVQPAGAVKKK
jgi:hypothetical protein